MNANDMNAKTVKALNVIARDLGMKRYSKLRKADLVAAIVEFTTPEVKILDTEIKADHAEIVKIMAEVAPVTFSATPVKAPESDATPRKVAQVPVTMVEVEEDDTDDLIEAYRHIRKARHTARGALHISLTNKLRNLSRKLRERKVYMREV